MRVEAWPTAEAGPGALDPGAALFVDAGGAVAAGEVIARAAALSRTLSGSAACINLCERREAFVTAYLGALLARCTTLLPPSRAPEVVEEVAALHAGAVVLDDAGVAARALSPGGPGPVPSPGEWRIPADHIAMVGYTSGSTGRPSAHVKRWGSVLASTRENARAILAALPSGDQAAVPTIVGTVPSQHMYGMELTVLLPLLTGWRLHAARPLLPLDVASALREAPAPRILVSTPVHLRAILASGVSLPQVAVTISATAPMDAELAGRVEACTGGIVLEMFGSTETCIIARRQTARDPDWHAYPLVRLEPGPEGTRVEAPWFGEPQQLHDILELQPGGGFRVRGRSSDMIDVAGKRASLADLTARILAIPGVVDATVFQADGAGLVRRVAALVVAPGLDAQAVRAALQPAMDPVFMPRPLVLLPRLPRNAAGKLPREALLAALAADELQRAGATPPGI